MAWFTASTAKNHPPPGQQLHSTEEVLEYAPDAILVPGNIVPHFWPGLKVQIFHGIDDEPKGFYRITGFFDLYCTPGPVTTARFDELAQRYKHFLVKETGWPKLDPVSKLTSLADEEINDLKANYGLNNDSPVILYAPTFPPKYTSAPDLLPAITGLKDKYQWLIKFHPLMNPDIRNEYESLKDDRFKICDRLNVIDYMLLADLLITDTSSVAYEFLPFNRPLITFRAIARQDKGINIQDARELSSAIERSLVAPMEFESQRKKYLNQIHPHSDGNSARRILDCIEMIVKSEQTDSLKSKPHNWVRKYQIKKLISG